MKLLSVRNQTTPSLDKSVPVEVGREYDVAIHDIAREGDGIAKIQGFIIFIPETNVSDLVRIHIRSSAEAFRHRPQNMMEVYDSWFTGT